MIGIRRSRPNAFVVTRTPGGHWRRLYSAMSTRRVDAPHDGLVGAELDDLAGRAVLLDVGLEDRVEHLVRRQALVVALVGPQLGRRRLRDDGLGDQLPTGPLG